VGHANEPSRRILAVVKPAEFVAYAERFPQIIAEKRIAATVERARENAGAAGADAVAHLLPPLDAAGVLRHLDAPAELAELQEGERADPGRTYVSQVERAVRGFPLAGIRDGPLLAEFAALLYHVGRFHALMIDPGQPRTVREAALLAFSYWGVERAPWHGLVVIELGAIARNPAHPAWRAAVSRLGDIGDGSVLAALEAAAPSLAPPESDFFQAERRRLQRRESNLRREQLTMSDAVNAVQRLAWAELAAPELVEGVRTWAVAVIAEAKGVDRLQPGNFDYEGEWLVDPISQDAFNAASRRWAAELVPSAK
jgi:hypothetical protein